MVWVACFFYSQTNMRVQQKSAISFNRQEVSLICECDLLLTHLLHSEITSVTVRKHSALWNSAPMHTLPVKNYKPTSV